MKVYSATKWYEEESSGYVLVTGRRVYEICLSPFICRVRKDTHEEYGTSWRFDLLGICFGFTPIEG